MSFLNDVRRRNKGSKERKKPRDRILIYGLPEEPRRVETRLGMLRRRRKELEYENQRQHGIDKEKAQLLEKLQAVEMELETEKKRSKEEIQRLSEDLKKANKALEEERCTRQLEVKGMENVIVHLVEKLQAVEMELETEKKRSKEKTQRLSEDLKKANKALEEERCTRELEEKEMENEIAHSGLISYI